MLVSGVTVIVCLLGFAGWAALEGFRIKVTPQEEVGTLPPVVVVPPTAETSEEESSVPLADPQWISIPAAGIEHHLLTAVLNKDEAASPAYKQDDGTEFINWYAGGGRLGQDPDDPAGQSINIYCHTSDWDAICDDVQLLRDEEDLGTPLILGNNETGEYRFEFVGYKIVHRDDIGSDELYNTEDPMLVKVVICERLGEEHERGTPSTYRMIALFQFVEYTPIDEAS